MTSSGATAPERPAIPSGDCPRVYWHRELPPVDADITGEHVLVSAATRGERSIREWTSTIPRVRTLS